MNVSRRSSGLMMSNWPLVRPRSNDDVLDDTSNEIRSNNGDLYFNNNNN